MLGRIARNTSTAPGCFRQAVTLRTSLSPPTPAAPPPAAGNEKAKTAQKTVVIVLTNHRVASPIC